MQLIAASQTKLPHKYQLIFFSPKAKRFYLIFPERSTVKIPKDIPKDILLPGHRLKSPRRRQFSSCTIINFDCSDNKWSSKMELCT
jgi:hypothetical protein